MLCTAHTAESGSSVPTVSSPCASASDVCAPCVSVWSERAVCMRVCFEWAAVECAPSAQAWSGSVSCDRVEVCGSWLCSFQAFLIRVFWSDERSPFPLLRQSTFSISDSLSSFLSKSFSSFKYMLYLQRHPNSQPSPTVRLPPSVSLSFSTPPLYKCCLIGSMPFLKNVLVVTST